MNHKRVIDGMVYDAQSDYQTQNPDWHKAPQTGGLPDLSQTPPLTQEEIDYLEIPSFERAGRLIKILEKARGETHEKG